MQHLFFAVDLFVHLDAYLKMIVSNFGGWTYAILFLVVFCETGLVVTPFLPGDSMLFMIGTLAAAGSVGLLPVFAVFASAAVLGDTVNYHLGKRVGLKAFSKNDGTFFKKENLRKAEFFYEKWGAAAVILGRFMPIIRTFVPFVAGIGTMPYRKFLFYNVIGGVLWVSVFTFGGYFFGNVPLIRENLTPFIYGIIAVSLLPGILGALAARNKQILRKNTNGSEIE